MAATLFVFWPLGNHEFINLDDDVYVYANPQVKAGLSRNGVIWAFRSLEAGNWHPLTWLSHMLDCELYGLHSGWHHVTSLLFHIANTLLLFWVLRRMTGRLWQSSFVAALFALHPLHVESVAWVAERKDVLSTFFWMLTLWAYLRYVEQPGLTRYLLAILFFVLGLLSKPMLVTLPFVLLLLDYWPLGRFPLGQPSSGGNSSTRRLVLEKIPFFSFAAVSSLVTLVAQQGAGAVQNLEYFPLEARIGNALVSYIVYIGKMIRPHPLAVLYPHPGMLPMWQVAGAGLLLVCGSILVVRASRKYPYLLVGWLWYLGTLVPVIGLVQVGSQGMADRYTYVPLIGLFIMIAWGLADILTGWRYRKATLAVSAGVLLSIFMVVTSLQIGQWHDNIRLFTHTLKVTEHNAIIHYNLGVALSNQRKDGEAMVHYKEALWIEPNYVEAHNNLGFTLARQGKNEEAIAQYSEALRINPKYVEAHNNLGIALARQGRNEEALSHFVEALRINPNFADAHCNLGNVLSLQGKTQEAIAHFIQALRIKPDFAEAHFSLGMCYFRVGNQSAAMEEYKILKRINSEMANGFAKKIFK
jgi:tetratricopeptide (TPR) repeat protein